MSELSERSGVSIATIKFYLREKLMPPGEATSPNQSTYGDVHIDRLRLVRALTEVGGLSVAAVRRVLAAVDDTDMPLDWAFGIAQRAVSSDTGETGGASAPAGEPGGRSELASLVSERGWTAAPDNPGRELAARVLDTYASLGYGNLIGTLPAYADAAEIVARADLAAVKQRAERSDMVETVVIGTVLGDSLFAGLRRIAQESVSNEVFPAHARAARP